MELFEYLYRQSHLLRIYECSAIAELRYFVLTNSVQLNSFLLFEIAKSSQINACKGINLKLLNALIAHRLSARITKPFAGKSRFCDHLYYWRITRLHRTHTVRQPCAVTDPLRGCLPSHFLNHSPLRQVKLQAG